MKKMFLLVLVSAFSLTTSFADDLDNYSATCLSAGGYYGFLNAKTTDNGKIKVHAAQGFAHKLSKGLNLRPSSNFRVLVDKEDCKTRETESGSKVIQCRAQNVQAQFTAFNPDENGNYHKVVLIEDISFSLFESSLETVEGTKDSFNASLEMKMLNDKGVPVRAEAVYVFVNPLGECRF